MKATRTSKRRTYDDGCAAAHALDLVGERWALLIVRELLLGPKRFTDLKAGLPGASPQCPRPAAARAGGGRSCAPPQASPARSADHTVFVGGDDAEAKHAVTELLRSFGWNDIVDLGDITTARGTEMLLPVWLRLFGALRKPVFNFKIVR